MTSPTRSPTRSPRSRSTTLRALRSLALALSVVGSPLSSAPVKFEIPAQRTPAALSLFIKQSGAQVAFAADELKEVMANAVTGEHEPSAALGLLLKNTGYTASERSTGWFTVAREAAKPGSVTGSLMTTGGKSLASVMVTVLETGERVAVSGRGEFKFPSLPPGAYTLGVSGEGFSRLKITDVVVRAGIDTTLGMQDLPALKSGDDVQTMKEMVVSAKKDVTTLATVEVTGERVKPFSTANVDLPRTIDDVQPYFVYDAKTVETSGVANLEEFLKERVTMNAVVYTNGQEAVSSLGNTSTVNLRGLGADKTLILINGRRQAGVAFQVSDLQPDLNGISLSSVERIEVLPSSASGIYGAGAVGGVVNIILKQHYAGGEIRLAYDNTWDTDAAKRNVDVSYGTSLENGRTQLRFSASWSDAHALLFQDRRNVYAANQARIMRNSPDFIFTSALPFLGALPNITPNVATQTNLVLKNGAVINSRNTFIAAGTSPTTSASELYASLAANAGNWNFDLPASTQSPTGLRRPFAVTPQSRSLRGSVRRQMWPRLTLFADWSMSENRSHSIYNGIATFFSVPITAPNNPFTTAVRVTVPDASTFPQDSQSTSRSANLGAILKLPWDWTGELEYAWSDSHFRVWTQASDSTARQNDINSGVLNPFVDTLRFPLSLGRYFVPLVHSNATQLQEFSLRGSGPVARLPWGAPALTLGLGHRVRHTPTQVSESNYPITITSSSRTTFFPRDDVTDSGYAEATVPLAKPDWVPGVHALDLQVSGRAERFTVDTGTQSMIFRFNTTNAPSFTGATTNGLVTGQPYFSKATYTSKNVTAGLKYQPLRTLSLRVSRATAFSPPNPAFLIKNLNPSTATTPIIDPAKGLTNVRTLGGGNPDLKPQSSVTEDAGIIWRPRGPWLEHLRFNAEYNRTEQSNAVGGLSAQEMVNQESSFPGRLTRDASGVITDVDISAVNLFHRANENWDLSVDYELPTAFGRFTFHVAETIMLHLKTQYVQTKPEYEAAGYHPQESGAPKLKSTATLGWERAGWTASWTARSVGTYKAYGAAGGPFSMQFANGANYATSIQAQGSTSIPAQTYHDLFVGYAFGSRNSSAHGARRLLGALFSNGLTLQLGVRNVFDTVPPMDVGAGGNITSISPGGDIRLRTYRLSLKKPF